MKLDAFQRIEELQSQLPDTEQLSVQMSSPGGKHALPSLGESSSLRGLNCRRASVTSNYDTVATDWVLHNVC